MQWLWRQIKTLHTCRRTSPQMAGCEPLSVMAGSVQRVLRARVLASVQRRVVCMSLCVAVCRCVCVCTRAHALIATARLQAELLDLLHGARTKLEAANDANDELYTKIVETRENTLKCDQERLTQKRKFEEKREELRETREAFAALKADLGCEPWVATPLLWTPCVLKILYCACLPSAAAN